MAGDGKKRSAYKKHRTSFVPTPNPDGYGARWQWDERKYKVAEYLAQGYSQRMAGELAGCGKTTVQNWLRIPEFCSYIDNLIYETGIATKRMRIGKLKRMAERMEEVFYAKAEQLMLDPTEERLKDVSQEFREILKQIAIEKEEWIELNRTEHDVKGSIDINAKASIENVEKYLLEIGEDERETLRKEFEAIADKYIADLNNN